MRTLPDGLDGAVMAVESIEGAAAFLHGPGGCRVRLMVHSSAVMPREDDGPMMMPYFNGYPRVPATYLDEYDYINGAFYKLDEGLGIVDSTEPALIVTIDSPGAALIGDDHDKAIAGRAMSDRAMHMDASMVSMPMQECYGLTLRMVMEHLAPERGEARKGTVLLLGLTIMDKDWRYARDELSGLLEAMGFEVLCAPGAGASVDDLKRSVDAEYATVVCTEPCAELSDYYEKMGVKVVRSPMGAPVGFDAARAWVQAMAEASGCDPSAALKRIDDAESMVRRKMLGLKYNALRIRGLTFSVAGISSVVLPLTEWLYGYLGMAPAAVITDPGSDPAFTEDLRRFLESADYACAFGREPVDSDVVLCEGITALTMQLNGSCRIGIPIGQSSMGLDDIIPRPVFGIQGTMYIIDELMHGVRGS